MTVSHYKYYLGTIARTEINDRIELSKGDYEFTQKILKDFTDLIRDERLFRIVELNYQEIKLKIADYTLKVKADPNAGFDEIDEIYIDVNRLLLNLLSTIRTFLDHKGTSLKRKFGKDSEEYRHFEKETNIAYDNNFEYRFISKLRNYAQHCGLPAGPPEIKSYADENFGVQNDFNIYFEKNKLLDDFDWGKAKIDLESQTDRFEVLPIVEKVYNLLSSINKSINDRIIENYKKEGMHLISLMNQTSGFLGMPCIMKREGSETLTYHISWFPLDFISKVTGVKINFNYV
jgi:hypothetical protein